MTDNLREALLAINCMTFENGKVIADMIRAEIDTRIFVAAEVAARKQLQAAEPRRNPYEDWGVDNSETSFSATVKRLLIEAYERGRNEGAQSAGGRDE